jgi:hypothetical protein
MVKNSKEKKIARALAQDRGISYTAALRIVRENYARLLAEKGAPQPDAPAAPAAPTDPN